METFYCKSLRAFHERWLSHAEKASSNSVKTIWKEVLGESAELGRLHGNLKDRISDEVSSISSPFASIFSNFPHNLYSSTAQRSDVNEH